MAQLEAMQVRFESLTEHIDTSTAGGRMQLNGPPWRSTSAS
jgi:hypothetical protein